MKNYNFKFFLFLLLILAAFSCKKSLELEPGTRAETNYSNSTSSESGSSAIQSTIFPALGSYLTNVTFCSPKVVPLCAGQHINIGTVTVKTGSDNNVYVTYSLKANWYLKELHLYAGDDDGIPVNGSGNPVPGHFPYSETFLPPYTVQEYTFVIPNLSSYFTIAAHASVVKIASGNGNIIDQQTAWGDGCDGSPITDQGNWGTKFNYTRLNCMVADICTKPLKTYFDSTVNGLPIAWPATGSITMSLTGDVTINVAGYTYTEAEGRAIYNTMNTSNPPESRNGFIHIAALKLSGTNYSLDADVQTAVTTVEGWLLTRGKLSPNNLPVCTYPAVKNAIVYLDLWINTYTCPDRR